MTHTLVPDHNGDPSCTCGFRATPSDTIRTVYQAAARVARHAAVRNRLDARPVVYRVVPHGYCDMAAVIHGRPHRCWRVVPPTGGTWAGHYLHRWAVDEATNAARLALNALHPERTTP